VALVVWVRTLALIKSCWVAKAWEKLFYEITNLIWILHILTTKPFPRENVSFLLFWDEKDFQHLFT